MHRLSIKTRNKREVLDITDLVEDQLGKNGSASGVCHLLVGTYEMRRFRTATAQLAGRGIDIHFSRYDAKKKEDHNPAHVPDHILSALIGTSLSLPFDKRKLLLGTWQRIVLVELDGPRERELALSISAEQS